MQLAKEKKEGKNCNVCWSKIYFSTHRSACFSCLSADDWTSILCASLTLEIKRDKRAGWPMVVEVEPFRLHSNKRVKANVYTSRRCKYLRDCSRGNCPAKREEPFRIRRCISTIASLPHSLVSPFPCILRRCGWHTFSAAKWLYNAIQSVIQCHYDNRLRGIYSAIESTFYWVRWNCTTVAGSGLQGLLSRKGVRFRDYCQLCFCLELSLYGLRRSNSEEAFHFVYPEEF